MPSAWHDTKGWRIQFRGIDGKPRRQRITLDPPPADLTEARRRARSHATWLQTLVDQLRTQRHPPPHLVSTALDAGAITQDQADALLSVQPALLPSSPAHPGLIELYHQHPAASRTERQDQRSALRAHRDLQAFIDWSGLRIAADLRLHHVTGWIDELRRRGYAWDTRRHYLLPLRRAAAMLPSIGIPDPISRQVLDRREISGDQSPDVWTLSQILHAIQCLQDQSQHRHAAAIALCGLLGLRISELARVLPADLDQIATPAGPVSVLQIGRRHRKNNSSRRDLPLPRYVHDLLSPVLAEHPAATARWRRSWRSHDPQPDLPLVWSEPHGSPPQPWSSPDNLARSLAKQIHALGHPRHPAKALRASFATWTTRSGIPASSVESYLGHSQSSLTTVTNRHYLARARALDLLPAAAQLQHIITTTISTDT